MYGDASLAWKDFKLICWAQLISAYFETAYNVEYSPKFFERDHSPVFLSKPKNI